MPRYLMLLRYTSQGIANIKQSPGGWTPPAKRPRKPAGRFTIGT